ncbi:TonB-dependent receptor [Sphingomonas sp.]|uniref:TonB-dependent receptor domain-containing protein n=1 Tax=Sphingomonas sp. TaxID=28214 RepID=UPI0017AA2D95|nr:TonB-dependent receptor [Sphingomonas sp.]MBA3511209.1 TonB-dependent receptor [Sphingomonas sp.]
MCAIPTIAHAQTTQPEEETTKPAPTPTTAETPVQPADETSRPQPDTGEIIVTGSRIRRNPNDSALPLQIITTQEIERNAINNPEALIAYITTNGTGGDNLASNVDVVAGAQRGNAGASFANLRGQGSGATLILLNGRRVAAHGLQGSAVDVNQIPFAAVERVEVLKEGASAIYGTDAIGGVINFILRKDYQGLGLQGSTDVAEAGDHTIFRTSAIAGYGDLASQGFNVMAAVSWSDIPELRANQRDFVDTFQPERGLSVDTRGTPHSTLVSFAGTFFPNAASFPFIPGTTTRASGGINVLDLPGAEGCDAIRDMAEYDAELWDFSSAALACAWDTGRAASLQQKLETLTWLGRGVVAFGNHEVTAEITGSDAASARRFSNLQVTPFGAQPLRFPVGAPGYDEVYNRLIAAFPELASRPRAPFAYRWRCMECGRREIFTDTKTNRYVLGVDGPAFLGWNYRAGASYASSESQSELGTGYYFRGTLGSGAPDPRAPTAPGAATPGLIGLLNSGILNPFLLPGQQQTPEAIAALEAVSAEGVVLYGGKYSVSQLDGSLSGDLFELPGGTMKAAIGVDYRKEKYRFNGDEREALARPVIMAAPFDDANALEGVSRNIKAAYAELLLPLFDGFELTAAGRIDDYSDFGTTTNPMVAFKYRPIRSLMFRGNYNTGFRAPTFNQVHNGTLESPFAGRDLADPATCPGARPDQSVPGCESLERAITIFTGGNPNLGPETAKMASLGVVFQPMPRFSASLDWWHIKRENSIQTLTLRQLVDNFELFPERFIRDANGDLLTIDQTWINAGIEKTQGLEVVLRGAGDLLGGRVSGGLDGTYLLKKEEAAVQGGELENQRGVFTFSGDLGLKWKHNAFVSYGRGPWTLALTQIYRSGYENQELPGVEIGRITPPDLVERVDDYTVYNLSAAFDVSERMRMTMGVKNLFDKDPPFAITYDSNLGSGSSWDPRVADPRGRSFTLNVDVKF